MKSAERRSEYLDPQPDLDNANVGNIERIKCICAYTFFEKRRIPAGILLFYFEKISAKYKWAGLDQYQRKEKFMETYTTQMDAARKGIITPQMKVVAAKEHMQEEEIRKLVAEGKVAICANKNHTCLDAEGEEL